jgi:hypothetical protein
MGEARKDALRVGFDRSVKLEFHGSTVSRDAGLLAYRDLDEAFALTALAGSGLTDLRTGTNIRHGLTALLRQSIYGRLAGYDDLNDAERLAVDPVMRQIVGGRAIKRGAASTSQMAWFETDVLTQPQNLAALMTLPGQWIDRVRQTKPIRKLILDLDSSVSETYGQQEGSAYNGHFGCECYHPLFCFNQDGDVEAALLREGNVASAHEWPVVLTPVLDRYRNFDGRKLFRGDAAFASPELYEQLEAEGYGYAIRLPGNDVLYRQIQHLTKRPVGRPPARPVVMYHRFEYQAGSWDRPRTVAAKVEWRRDELLPHIGFVVTNLRGGAAAIIRFYNGRGTAEQAIKEGKVALNWTRLSCHDFDDNQVRLQLFVLAYNLGNFLRRLALPAAVSHWTLTTLLVKLIKTGAKVVRHARYVTFQLAEVAVPRKLFASIVARIRQWAIKARAGPMAVGT